MSTDQKQPMTAEEKFNECMQLHSKNEPVPEIFEKYRKELDRVKSKLDQPDAEGVDDIILYKFLRGWKFDEEKAISQFNLMVKWKEENNMWDLRKKVRPLSQDQWPFAKEVGKCIPQTCEHGFDKEGQPISITRVGHIKMTLLLQTLKYEDLRLNQLYSLEKKAVSQIELTEKNGKLSRACTIVDLEGLSRDHINTTAIGWLKSILAEGNVSYPESLGNMYIVNAPWTFTALWSLIKPCLKETTQKKIQVLGDDYKDVLRQKN